jgi:phosphopantetheine adenylyltransferase
MELEKTILYSRLLPDIPTIHIFMKQSLIYLNGKIVKDSKTTTLQNDLIQFIISK